LRLHREDSSEYYSKRSKLPIFLITFQMQKV
jgi:hypothetical protein